MTYTLFNDYTEWKRNEDNRPLFESANILFQAAVKEVCIIDGVSNIDLEELFRHIEYLGFCSLSSFDLPLKLWRGFYTGYENKFVRLLGAECINCAVFSLIFQKYHKNEILVINKNFLTKYNWKTLMPFFEHNLLKHIFLPIDDIMGEFLPDSPVPPPVTYYRNFVNSVFDPVLDKFYFVADIYDHTSEMIDHSYPTEEAYYRQEIYEIEESDDMKTKKEELFALSPNDTDGISDEFWREWNRQREDAPPKNVSIEYNQKQSTDSQTSDLNKRLADIESRISSTRKAVFILFVIVVFFGIVGYNCFVNRITGGGAMLLISTIAFILIHCLLFRGLKHVNGYQNSLIALIHLRNKCMSDIEELEGKSE